MFPSFFDLAFLNESAVETFLRNCSFCTLFISMMFYWIQTAFSSPKNVAVGYLSKFADFGTMTMILSNLLLVCLLIVRWKESGHFPLSNLYESLMFLSWSCTVIHLVLERIVKTTPTSGFPPTEGKTAKLNANLFTKLIGSITSPSALFTNAFATFSLPIEMQKASPLVPALQSNWLMMHVTVMIVSYSALILGSLLAIAFLVLISFNSRDEFSLSSTEEESSEPKARRVKEREGIFTSPEGTPLSLGSSFLSMEGKEQKVLLSSTSDRAGALIFSITKNSLKDTLAWNFDNLSYRILGIGFPFLTIGILSGAVWANEAWGSYWSWDPKETWALLTWLIFAIYLHARITKGWQGKKPAIIASFGFLAIWICFLGVNLIGEGLHSYGWFSVS